MENKKISHENVSKLTSHGTFLVAGGTGQVGLTILRHLNEYQVPTLAFFHRTIPDFFSKNIIWIQGDIEKARLDGIIAPVKTLIHTPAIWHLPKNIPQLKALGIERIIAFSSTSIEGKAGTKNTYEQALISKFIQAEKDLTDLCHQHNIGLTLLRPTLIYGCGLDRNVSSIHRFIKKLGFFPLAMPGRGLRQPVHVDDLALAALLAITNNTTIGKTYNLSGATSLTYRDMVNRVAAIALKPRAAIRIPFLVEIMNVVSFLTKKTEFNGEIARRMNIDLVFDSSEAREDFGYDPLPFLSRGSVDLGLES